jgi:PTS system mannose-specific IIB component
VAVVLARVDNRLVHGQVLEAWVPALDVEAILVVDPELGGDRLQKMVLEGLSRQGLRIQIVTPGRLPSSCPGCCATPG